MYKGIVDQMKCYERLKLTDWINKATLLTAHQMNCNILVCTRKIDDTGKCNYCNLYFSNIIERLKYK